MVKVLFELNSEQRPPNCIKSIQIPFWSIQMSLSNLKFVHRLKPDSDRELSSHKFQVEFSDQKSNQIIYKKFKTIIIDHELEAVKSENFFNYYLSLIDLDRKKLFIFILINILLLAIYYYSI